MDHVGTVGSCDVIAPLRDGASAHDESSDLRRGTRARISKLVITVRADNPARRHFTGRSASNRVVG